MSSVLIMSLKASEMPKEAIQKAEIDIKASSGARSWLNKEIEMFQHIRDSRTHGSP